jgi:hypothetical protein
MLFLAHCTFEDRGGEQPTHGYLTYLVKAGDVEAALEQLRARLVEAREEEGLFDGPARVYTWRTSSRSAACPRAD